MPAYISGTANSDRWTSEVVAEPVALADELGDDDQDQADRHRDAQPGHDRRECRREVDPEDPLHAADVEHRRGIPHLRRDEPHAFGSVDEDREAEAERDDGDALGVAEAEDDDRGRHDGDRRNQPAGARGTARALVWPRCDVADQEPDADADRGGDGESDREPLQARSGF